MDLTRESSCVYFRSGSRPELCDINTASQFRKRVLFI
jgi:hypothetical protein